MSTIKEKIKENPTEWIAIAISFFVGLSSLFTSLYTIQVQQASIQAQKDMAVQQNNTQKQIVQLQADTTRAYNSARVQLRSIRSGFEIKNSGLANATNVGIFVTIFYINDIWNKSITNINQFVIEPSNQAYGNAIDKTVAHFQNAQKISGNNAYHINIPFLPSGEDITFTIDFDSSVATETKPPQTSNIVLYSNYLSDQTSQAPSSNTQYIATGIDILTRYLHSKNEVASFDVSLTCSNCNFDNKSYPREIVTSFYTDLDIISGDPTSVHVNDKFYQISYQAIVTNVVVPKGLSAVPLGSPLNLKATKISFSGANSPQSYVPFHHFQPSYLWPDLWVTKCTLSQCTHF